MSGGGNQMIPTVSAEEHAQTCAIGDEVAAAAARVCAEYDGVHRLRAAIAKWFDHRAGIHGGSR